MQSDYEPPSMSLESGPDPIYLRHQRDLRAMTDAERKADKFRPDGHLMRALRVGTYVIVIVTCAAVLSAILDMYQFLGDLREALNSFSNTMTTEGILGN